MKKSTKLLTTAEFAKLHEVNKRTLHYYDSIGLFSPAKKGENQYRYYETSQSMEFEYIRMLKELNMSMEEIKKYIEYPNSKDFLQLADAKISEIDRQMETLIKTRHILSEMKSQTESCEQLKGGEIFLKECEEQQYLTTPYNFEEEFLEEAFVHVKEVWGIEQCRMGIGSYLSVKKAEKGEFQEYDGLFTPAFGKVPKEGVLIKPKGTYLCAYLKGSWNALPKLYEKMFAYAKEKKLRLTGFAYEWGMNDFSVSKDEDYITRIMIKAEQM